MNGYIERLQRPENLIYFFHDVVGIACIEPAVLEQRTNAYTSCASTSSDPSSPASAQRSYILNPKLRLPLINTTNAYASTCNRSFRSSALPHEQRRGCRSLFVNA